MGKNSKNSVLEYLSDAPWRSMDKPFMGLLLLIPVLFLLACLSTLGLENRDVEYQVGDIALSDVLADRELMVVDEVATALQLEKIEQIQPAIFDLSTAAISTLRTQVLDILERCQQSRDYGQEKTPQHHTDSLQNDKNPSANTNFTLKNFGKGDNDAAVKEMSQDPEALRLELAELLNAELSLRSFELWQSEKFAEFMKNDVLPWLEVRMAVGVVGDQRFLTSYRQGIIMRDLNSGQQIVRDDTRLIIDLEGLTHKLSSYLRYDLQRPLLVRKAVTDLIIPLVNPTLTLNREATTKRVLEVQQSMPPVQYRLQEGELIIRQGERITDNDLSKLNALWDDRQPPTSPLHVLGIFLTALVLLSILSISPRDGKLSITESRDFIFIATVLVLFSSMAKGFSLLTDALAVGTHSPLMLLPFLLPLSGAGALLGQVFSFRRCAAAGLLLAFLCTAMTGGGSLLGGIDIFLFFFLSCSWGAWLIQRTENRHEVVVSVVPLLCGLATLWLALAFLDSGSMTFLAIAERFAYGLGFVLFNAVLSLMLVFALNPLIDMGFGYTTRFRLMELMNLEQPLLQELMVTAPGTYHHSLIVSNMVEAGAKAIGANSLLCKVAALYHDIGKTAKPLYFVENQAGGNNPHNKLAPSMSSLILQSHVKRGAELGKQHRLGRDIIDIIQQHHGTSCIRYFYKKAQDNNENPQEQDYRYPGPKPQSREAAIVMLADVLEASSRTLTDPTPSRIRGHVRTIVEGVLRDGQLEETELTFKQVHDVAERFEIILNGIFHRRIAYPADAAKADVSKTDAVKAEDAKAPDVKTEVQADSVKAEAKMDTKADAKGESVKAETKADSVKTDAKAETKPEGETKPAPRADAKV